jgi:hypothetical protein
MGATAENHFKVAIIAPDFRFSEYVARVRIGHFNVAIIAPDFRATFSIDDKRMSPADVCAYRYNQSAAFQDIIYRHGIGYYRFIELEIELPRHD